MKKCAVLVLLAALLCSMAGCGSREENTLWVVTEETTWDRMNGQAWVLQAAFEESHPGVKVNIDILPTGEQERAAYLQKLRTQIMQGGGPDAYLLPTDNTLTVGDAGRVSAVYVELLFSDVMLAVQSGVFQDISDYYEADDALGKESLNTTVMDAGVVDGKRYILPLRYDIPVIYAEKWTLEELGFDTAVLEKPLPEIMAETIKTGDPLVIAGGVYDGAGIFGDWIDYTTGDASVTQDALQSYMEAFQTQVAATSEYDRAYRLDLVSYIYGSYDRQEYAADRFPLFIGGLKHLLEYAPVAQYEQSDYAFLPLQSVGGGTVATVTYYAAVGSGCKQPALAYEFLRQFLTEESQWEENRPAKMNVLQGVPPSKTIQDKSTKSQQAGLIENGWPVRTQGSLNPVWNIRRIQFYNKYSSDTLAMRKIGRSQLEESYGEILDAPIGQVRFPSEADRLLTSALQELNYGYEENFRATDADPQEMAKALLWEIRRHTAEG